MSIEIGSKWVKDGEVVEVFNIKYNHFDDSNPSRVECVWFCDKQGIDHVLTERDFLEQYKPYEVVYEFECIAQQPNGDRHYTGFMTEKEMEYFSFQNDCAYYQRIDFTKRERKCGL